MVMVGPRSWAWIVAIICLRCRAMGTSNGFSADTYSDDRAAIALADLDNDGDVEILILRCGRRSSGQVAMGGCGGTLILLVGADRR